MLFITISNLNPSAIKIGFIDIRWYSLAYIAGIILGWFLIRYFNKISEPKVFDEKKMSEDFFLYAVLGIVLGGRLGYVLFYNFSYYIHNPLLIFAIWTGGMSFHGGLVGCLIACYLICKKQKVDLLRFLDLCAIQAPIGLFLGRIANFINMELYGRETSMPWGVIFPTGGEIPRHPSQLYEAFFEGIVLFALLFYLAKFTKSRNKKGLICGIAILCYGLFRIFVEFFREPDIQLGFIFNFITMGQLLSIPIIVVGIYMINYALKKGK